MDLNITDDEIKEIENMAVITESPLDRSVRDLKNAYERGEFDPHPDFQRNPGVWKIEQKTRLIESILLKVKLPRIYMSEVRNPVTTPKGQRFKDEIIDGQQRITTIFDFINNQFSLNGLNRAIKLEGARFKDLPEIFQNRILDTTLNVIRITRDSNPETKYFMFENLNRGSVSLNKQEFRESYYHSPLVMFVRNLAADVGHFKQFVESGGFTKPIVNRKKPEELIAKALAFHVLRVDAYKDKEQFINLFYETYKDPVKYHLDCPEFKQWHDSFSEACLTINRIFGTRPFCIQGQTENKFGKKFNEAIYDAYMYGFLDIKDFKMARQHSDDIYKATCTLYKNIDFLNAVTIGAFDDRSGRRFIKSTTDPVKIKRRLEMFKDLLKQACREIRPRLSDEERDRLHQRELDELEAKRDN